MNYCIYYSQRTIFKYFDEVAEIEILFNRDDDTLPRFLEEHQNQTIVIDYYNQPEDTYIKDINLFKALYEKYHNIKLKIDHNKTNLLTAVKGSGIPYFFTIFVDNWDVLNGLIELGPTDMYITNDLGFDIINVAAKLHEKNIKIRVFPNFAQSSWDGGSDLNKFFILPQDMWRYNDYVDICEFIVYKQQKISNQQVYYEIYEKEKKWSGLIGEIIIGFKDLINNPNMNPSFARYRVSCKKKCAVNSEKCSLCFRNASLSNTLTNSHLRLHLDDAEIL